jgi:hypothetical protein
VTVAEETKKWLLIVLFLSTPPSAALGAVGESANAGNPTHE